MWKVTEEAVQNLMDLSQQLSDSVEIISNSVSHISESYEELKVGLGAHTSDIGDLVENVCGLQLEIKRSTDKLSLKLRKAAAIRRQHLEENVYRIGNGQKENSISISHNEGQQDFGSTSLSDSQVSQSPLTNKNPRDLVTTMQTFHTETDGTSVYNSPIETGSYLCPKQGNARKGFRGTCGLCSCANILRLAGVNISEGDVIDYASRTDSPREDGKLCEVGHFFPGSNGGTTAVDRKEILEHFGVSSGVFEIPTNADGEATDESIRQIADYVSAGRGVIISVHAYALWDGIADSINDAHAITVTSVKKDADGRVLGFYVNDTGKGGTYYYSSEQIRNALTGAPMNVTYQIIR